jgi:putative phosphoribosyl transferase
MFTDRTEAGQRLAEALQHHRGEDAVVLALPRGGVPVAVEIARALAAPLDLLIVRKIGVPAQPELAMGAVVDGADPIVVRNEDVLALTGVSDDAFDAVCTRELAEIERRRVRYLAGRTPVDVAGRVAIVVDDGLATGATMRAGLRALRKRKPKRIVLAVPVAPPDTIAEMQRVADEVVCLETPAFFSSIGSHYADFSQVEDAEVVAVLAGVPK